MIDNLVFYNKEGYQINMSNEGIRHSSIYFDKNSLDTFKTQGIYMFEKVDSSNNTFPLCGMTSIKSFNTNGFNFIPKYTEEHIIENITIENNSNTYNTKWIYSTGIENFIQQGMYVYFTGLDSYHNNDFDTQFSDIQVRKVLNVEKNRILVYTQTTNDIPLALFNIINAKIIPLNIIEVIRYNEPLWNNAPIIHVNNKFTLLSNSENDNVYTVDNIVNNNTKQVYKLSPTLYSPTAGDKIQIKLELKTSNILVTTGDIQFNSNTLIVPYIPSYLKVGDTIMAKEKTTPLSLGNDSILTIQSINYLTNTIEVDILLTNEIIDCLLYKATNIFEIVQDIVLDNNNLYSLPVTYNSIETLYSNELNNVSGGFNIIYDNDTDELIFESNYLENYSSIEVNVIDINNNITNYPIVPLTYDVYLINTKEQLIEENLIKDTKKYHKEIVFTNIDNLGIRLEINTKKYFIPFDTDISTTINNFILSYYTELYFKGIILTQSTTNILNDTLVIDVDFPNVNIFVEPLFGDNTEYYTKYLITNIENIKTQLLITINDIEYFTNFNVSDALTLSTWCSLYEEDLKLLKIKVSSIGTNLYIDVYDIEKRLDIKYNIGYIPKSGDLSIYETYNSTFNEYSLINYAYLEVDDYNFIDYYSVGQYITLNGFNYAYNNQTYNILSISNNKLSLSYQGPVWQEIKQPINIVSDMFIRYPRNEYGAKFRWTWKETQINDFFLYDFSGDQLKPYTENFPNYNGIKPLCGLNGEIELKLNKLPNKDINHINNPQKQQTIFDILEHETLSITESINNESEPYGIQVFIGYNATLEGWNKARLFLEYIENITYTNQTLINNDDLFIFKDNYVEVINITNMFDFNQIGFVVGQKIIFEYNDNNIDNKKLGILKNSGKEYTIKEVLSNKLIFEENVIEETSISQINKSTLPYFDINGNQLYEYRPLEITIKTVPRVITYFDIYGESEAEDERHKINLDNRNLNILKLNDFFIFKEVDIKEQGIDWILLNRKRKELIEIYPELFNSLSSYKSVIHAINFFGYNDLTFTEYFQNIDITSNKFGKIFNLELLNIFDKTIPGFSYSNLAYENLRNNNYRKTNLFSLNYNITDENGCFVNAYSLQEVQIKLLGLKKWLTENIIPIGTKILDINGKYKIKSNYTINHESYMVKNYNVEEYEYAPYFDVNGYLQPIELGSNLYNVSIQFKNDYETSWFSYVVRTFNLEIWNNVSYLPNSFVFYNEKIWTNTSTTTNFDIPGENPIWEETKLSNLPNIQIFSGSNYTDNSISFTCNELIDPYFIIEMYWHSGYGLINKLIKSYSLPISILPENILYI